MIVVDRHPLATLFGAADVLHSCSAPENTLCSTYQAYAMQAYTDQMIMIRFRVIKIDVL